MRGSSVWRLCTVLMACSNTAENTPPPIRTDAGLADLASRPDTSDTRDVLASDSIADVADIGASPDVELQRIPLVSGSPTSRLRLVVGATMVVTADKIRYGWGDRLGSLLGLQNAPPALTVQRVDLDEETYNHSFLEAAVCRWRRTGGGPVQCWGRPNTADEPWSEVPRDQPISDADLAQPWHCASRRDGVWCWPTQNLRDLSVDPSPTRRYDGSFCAFLPGWNQVTNIFQLCGYDCERAHIACMGIWTAFDLDGNRILLENTGQFSWNLPIRDVTALGYNGSTTFFAVRGDGSLWCRGYCGGERIGTWGAPHDDFRPVLGLPPVVFAEGNVVSAENGMYIENRACALLRDGTVTCWGFCSPNLGGECVRSRTAPSVVEHVGGLTNVVELAMSLEHACALTADDQVWCWGNNVYHAVLPTSTERYFYIAEPVRVELPPRH